MKEMKRILSLVLCFVMVVGLLPMSAVALELNTDTTDPGYSTTVEKKYPVVSDDPTEPTYSSPVEEEEPATKSPVIETPVIEDNIIAEMTDILATPTVLDAAIFCSDVHGSTSDLTSVLGGVKTSGVDYSSIGFVGDTCLTVAETTSIVQSALDDTAIAVMFSYAASHDTEDGADISTNWNYSGEVEKISNYYLVYTIRETDMQTYSNAVTASAAFTTWYSGLSAAQKKLPIFVMSHRPLHARRGGNQGGEVWTQAFNAAGATSDIVVFWAHNHTGETSVDTGYYYAEKGSTVNVANSSGSTSTANEAGKGTDYTIRFTYMNAGYINANNQNPARLGVATTVQITADSLIFQDYNSSGEYTGTYAHNVTVEREFAAEEVTLSSIAVSGDTEYFVGDELALTVTATYSDGTTKDVTADATLSGYDLSTAGTQTVTAAYEGLTATTSITVTAVQINSIAVTTQPTKTTYVTGETLDTTGMVVTATYNNGTTAEVTGWYTSAVDMTTAGTKEVTVKYAVDGITYQTTFTITVEQGVAEGVVLESIAITKDPDKTEYLLSQELDLDGMVVVATFSDGSTVELQYKPFSTSTIYGGYELHNFSMYVEKEHELKVVYTFGEVTCYDTTTINVWKEDFTDENTGVKVHVGDGDYGVTTLNVSPSSNSNVAAAVKDFIKDGTSVAYDITLTLNADGYALTNGEKTVTLPIPSGVNNPVVYYVSDDGATVTNMNAVKDGSGNVTFTTTHFSTYVVGESTEIEVPDPETATGSGSTTTTTTETKEVYVLVSSISAAGDYLIVDKDSATTSANMLTAANNGVTNTSGVTVISGEDADGNTVIYVEDPAAAAIWTASGSSTWTLYNSSLRRYLRYSSGLTTTNKTNDATSWYSDTNQLYRRGNSNSYWVRYSSGWGVGNSNTEQTVYIYQKQTVTFKTETTTTVSGTYKIEGEDLSAAVSAGSTADLKSTLTFTPDSGTATTTDVSTAATYEIVTVDAYDNTVDGDPNDIISKIENGVVTFTGNYGKALVKVSYTTDFGVVTDYITIEAKAPYYTINLHKANISFVEADITAFAEGVTYYTYDSTTETYVEVAADAEFDSAATYYTVSATVGDEITDVVTRKNVKAGDTYSVWAVIKEHNAEHPDGDPLGDVEDSRIYWTVSDESIATIDPHTGVITFTGTNYGTITVTAHYLDENGDILCSDAITISVSATSATVPNDGTDDFPEYPNEGAVRHDKTATAVGNFSETGIAKVELSMTGVPYSTGSEIDVAVMLDMSTSMDDDRIAATVAATKAFIESIVKNKDGSYNGNRVYVGYFNGDTVYTITDSANIGGELASVDNDTEYNALIADIEDEYDGALTASGTNYDVSLEKCYNILTAARADGVGDNRQQFCVFMSDGGPTDYATSASNVVTESTVDGWFDIDASDSADWTNSMVAEYWSGLMKNDGVTIYSVGLILNEAPSSGPQTYRDYSAAQNYYVTSTLLTGIASGADYFFNCESADDTDEMEGIFENIAQDILAAATDVTVADKIGSDYTMVFDAPNAVVDAADGGQEYYIEVTDYALVPVYADDGETITDYTRGTATSLLKLYFGYNETTGYYAATDAVGTAAATPVFEKVALGDKGTKFYWTTDSSLADADAISVVGADGVTYYFYSAGMSNTAEDFDSTKWYNMTSGAYASGKNTTVTLTDEDGTVTTSATCQNMIIASPYFVYDAESKMLIWTIEEISSSEMTLTYFLYLNNSGGFSGTEQEIDPDTYTTNQFAYVNYTNFNGNECQLDFPVPQMTWNGAQVSYVFYLVNEAGQPVNRAGRVVPFSEAVYVTDVYTYAIIWNDLEQSAGLDADRLAAELVPEVYELYDNDAAYSIHVYEDTEKSNLNNHFVISGDVTDADYSVAKGYTNAKTTYVFNTKADANKYNIVGAYVADDGDNTENESGLTYWCKDYSVTGTFDTVENTDELYGTYYTYTVTSAIYTGTGDQVAYEDLNSKTGASEIGGYAYYVDDEGKIYTIVTKTDGSEVEAGFDFANTTVAFAVVWKPELVEDTVVVDYGLDVVINVTTNDALASGVVGVRTDEPENIEINKGTYTSGKVTSVDVMLDGVKIGTASVENLNAVRFSLDKDNGMQFSEPATFYYESDVNYYKGNVLQNTSMYSKVTVIPATTVYYEDDFVVFESYTKTGEDWSIDEKSQWATSAQSGTQQQDRPGASKISEALDADNAYGYDKAYANMSQFSMGSAAKITVDANTYGTATFTFCGTGFDVISMTSNKTGTLMVAVKNEDGELVRNDIVDTYYGYTRNEDGSWEVTTSNNALYQVPVIKYFGMTYGTYTVTITAAYNQFFDHTSGDSYELYLDAIRVYDPTGNNNDVANEAYKADGEYMPSYFELRDKIITANSFNTLTGDEAATGIVFIDGGITKPTIADYTNYGPNNELYLASGESIAFDLSVTVKDGYDTVVRIGLKSVGGTAAVAGLWNAEDGKKVDEMTVTLNTATDMYYDISALPGGTVVITNTGAEGSILSITNIKVSFRPTTADAASLAETEEFEAPDVVFTVTRQTLEQAVDTIPVHVSFVPGKLEAVAGPINPMRPQKPVLPVKRVLPELPVEPIQPIRPVEKNAVTVSFEETVVRNRRVLG